MSTSVSLTDAAMFETSNVLREPRTDSVDGAIVDEEEIAVVEPFSYAVPKLKIIFINIKDTSDKSQEFLTTFFPHLIF